jgi:hypothetical protein
LKQLQRSIVCQPFLDFALSWSWFNNDTISSYEKLMHGVKIVLGIICYVDLKEINMKK